MVNEEQQFIAYLHSQVNELKGTQTAMLIQAGLDFVRIAKASAPVRTGNLRRNIQVMDVKDNEVTVGIPFEQVPYATVVRFGSNKRVANPFWDNAISIIKAAYEIKFEDIWAGAIGGI